MKRILLALLLFCMLHPVAGQNKTNPEYHVQLTTTDGSRHNGILVHVGDSVLQLVPVYHVKKGSLQTDAVRYTFAVRNVEQLRIRNKGSVMHGTLLGGGLGLVVGALIGYASYQPCDTNTSGWFDCIEILDQTESTIVIGAFGAILGAAIGSLAGSSRKRVTIRGDQATYMLEKEGLQQFVLQQ